MLRLLLGIDPGEGSLQLNGKPVEINSPRDGVHKGIAFLPEDRKDQGLILEQSILQNTILSILERLSKWGFVNTRKENGKIHVLFRELVKRGETYEHSY